MRIALLHGYRLAGSGSNEYTRYLARELARQGHEVHVLCREPDPQEIDFADGAFAWNPGEPPATLFTRCQVHPGSCTLHRIPHGELVPVYVTDKQRRGRVRPFTALTDEELARYRARYTGLVRAVLEQHPVDVVHANHVVLQPTVALDACAPLGIPVVVYPHGSAIEYTVRADPRYHRLAQDAIRRARGLITGSHEVRDRLCELFPEQAADIVSKSRIVGVGVDTSLFAPVPRSGRTASIGELIALSPRGGKSPALLDDLHRRLAAGEITAVAAYQDAYPRAAPDEDCAGKLGRIPWADGRIALFVGALTVGKGLQNLIAAWPAVLQRIPAAHLVIVGSGAYREALEALVYAIARGDARLLDDLTGHGYDLVSSHLSGAWPGVQHYLQDEGNRRIVLSAGPAFAEHVHFLGRLSHPLLRHLFPCADVAVFPSVVPEAYPLVLMESLSNGVLPAASSFSGFAEGLDALVDDLGEQTVNRLRLPVDPDEAVPGIASRLSALLLQGSDEDLRSRLRRIAVERYDWSIRARHMVTTYRELTRDFRS